MSAAPTHDVIVLGLGGMGSAAAAHLSARGARVLGLERFGPAHDQGSSHGDSRVIRQSYFEDPAYVPLLMRAYELWEQLERDSATDVIALTGGLYVGPETATVVAGSLASARAWDLPHEVLDAAEVRRRFPTFAPHDDEIALFEKRGGFVRPEATVTAHLGLAAGRGADLRFDEPVRGWSATQDGTRVEVRTSRQTYAARHLVITPGAWAPDVLAELRLPLRVTRQVLFWFQPRRAPERFDAGQHPVYVHESADGLQVYGFPGIDGPGGPAKVAFFRVGETTTAQTIDREVADAEVDDIRAATDAFLPDLCGELVKTRTCMYTNTPDEHFLVTTHPDFAQVTVGCGFSGHGFKFVPVIGEILADLALDGRTDHPIDLFARDRPALATALP